MEIDARGFNEVLKRAVEQSSREAADVVNGRLFAIVRKALQFTEKANREQIAVELGQVATKLQYTKKGDRLKKRAKGKAILREDSFAARIVNARIRDRLGPDYMLWGNALEQAAQRLIASRQRSVGFIKSGWIWAMRSLLPFVKFGARGNPDPTVKAVGVPKGSATPARMRAFHPLVATAINTSLIVKGTRSPLPVAEAGLRMAFANEQAEMERHLREKLMKAMRRAGATVA